GRTGYLLPPGDGQLLGEALRRVVDDPEHRRALGAAGRQRAVTRFNSRTNATRILELAHTLHAARHRHAALARA
ncbi:MAG: glycosyltransferase, partial [Chloroflexota bacterium]